MTRGPWYESHDPSRVARGAGWRIAVTVVAIVVFLGLLGVGIWAFKVATSDIKGQGDVVIKTNSAENRIYAQQKFEDRYQDILASDRKLDQADADIKADPTDRDARVRYSGLVNYCNDVVGKYNADARKITAAPFRADDLPYQIDPNDTRTDCKPGNR
jgi:hypothetical protein